MSDDITPKTSWVQKLNFINKSKEILKNFPLSGLKTLAYSGLLIYWSIILLGTFAL